MISLFDSNESFNGFKKMNTNKFADLNWVSSVTSKSDSDYSLGLLLIFRSLQIFEFSFKLLIIFRSNFVTLIDLKYSTKEC